MTLQFFTDASKLWNKRVARRTVVLCLIAIVASGCANFSLLSGGFDKNRSSSTVNGNAILKGKNAPPLPQERISAALVRASQEENQRIITAYGGVYSNRRVEDQLAAILARLIAKSEVPSQNFQVTILNSPTVNAFALPSGFLYITRGLLALANDASEVAAVMAHEMAHVTSQHGQQRLQEARKTQLITQAVQGVISDSSTLEAIQQRSQLNLAAFTQAQELEADIIGVRNAGIAGYDPFAAARFLETMSQYQAYRTASTVTKKADGPDFLSSHPTTPQRIEKARLSARQFGAPGFGARNREAYLNALDSMIFGDDPTEGFVRDRSFFHPQLQLTFSVPRGYIIDNTRQAVLATAPNGDAIRFDGVEVPGNLTLSEYLQAGWLNGLNPQSINTFTVNGASAASATAQVDEWNFKITVIRSESSTYRMIFATKNPTIEFDRAVSATVSSFRSLSPQEARNLSPLRLRIIRTKPGDTSFSLSRNMRGLVANPDQALRALNGLSADEKIAPGVLLKIITDDASR